MVSPSRMIGSAETRGSTGATGPSSSSAVTPSAAANPGRWSRASRRLPDVDVGALGHLLQREALLGAHLAEPASQRSDAVHQALEADDPVDGNGSARAGELVVPAPFALVAGYPIGGLLDEAVADETIEGPAQGAGAHPNGAVAQLRHSADQRVAVRLAIEQGQHHVQRRRSRPRAACSDS